MSYLGELIDENRARKHRLWHSAPARKPEPIPEPAETAAPPQACVEVAIVNERDILLADLRSQVETIASNDYHAIPLRLIEKTVAIFYGVGLRELRSNRRLAKLVRPRHVSYYIAKELTARSLPDIGRHMGGRDHTTIMHACRKIAALRLQDAELNAEINELMARLSMPEAIEPPQFIPAFLPKRAA